ncbi:MAG: sulfite exporter TauE/SafE family protein [Alphaproteobacteria bacterium]|nr:sulfite exporter TauE/SafE family protein [Alphaproteobacteria bacterium]
MIGLSATDPTLVALLIVGLLTTGLVAGVLAGLLGVGGGIVIVPVLYTVLEALGVEAAVRMQVAVATSLATIIPTSIASARAHARKGAVDWSLARRLAPWNFAGAVVGSIVAVSIDGRDLGRVFGAIGLLVALDLVRPRPDVPPDGISPSPATGMLTPIGTVIGFFSAMMGIGGGTLAVPTLTYMGVAMHRAVATSAVLGLAIALPSAIGFLAGGWSKPGLPPFSAGYINLAGFGLIAAMTFLTAPLGTRLAHTLSPRALRFAFAAFLAVTSGRILLAS